MRYGQHFSVRRVTQDQPIPGEKQVQNNDGAYVYAVDDWARLDRFLVLGSEGGSYYATERALTRENAAAVQRCIEADGPRTVARTAEISDTARAPKNDPAIFVLAMCLKLGNVETRKAAAAAVTTVCRTGTHLFQFAAAVNELGGWGRVTRWAVSNWYMSRSAGALARQVVKYRQRVIQEGHPETRWSHMDLLRLAHGTKGADPERAGVLRWAARGDVKPVSIPRTLGPRVLGQKPTATRTDEYTAVPQHPYIAAYEALQATTDPREAARMIREHNFPREAVPTPLLGKVEIWDALLTAGKGMPMTAMIRNLGVMTANGLLTPMSEAERFVCARLRDAQALKEDRVHPFGILLAQSIYRTGHGLRGDKTWAPSSPVLDALDDAFYLAFGSIEPTGKRHLIALDVSGSMRTSIIAGSFLSAREGSAVMAMATAKVEPVHHFMAFSGGFIPLDISPRDRLDTTLRKISSLPFNHTNCALPMLYALEHKIPVDVFIVYTDSETNAHGTVQPVVALRQYRQKTGIPAKLVVVGMVSNGFSLADPQDGGMLDVVGMDAAAPRVISDFVR